MSRGRVAALEQMLARVQKNRQATGVRPAAPAAIASPPEPAAAPSPRKERAKTPLEQAMTDSVEMELPRDEPAAAKAPEPPTPAAPPAAKAPSPPTPAAPPAAKAPAPATPSASGPASVAIATPSASAPVGAPSGSPASPEPATFGELMTRALGLRPR